MQISLAVLLFTTSSILLLIALLIFSPYVSLFSTLLFLLLLFGSYTDLKRMEIPDYVSVGLFPIGVYFWFLSSGQIALPILSSFGSFFFFLLFGFAFKRLKGYEGLGFGDVKLIASASAWLGPMGMPYMVLTASGSGIVASFKFTATGNCRTNATPFPFGPHLAFGMWVTWFAINAGYLDAPFWNSK